MKEAEQADGKAPMGGMQRKGCFKEWVCKIYGVDSVLKLIWGGGLEYSEKKLPKKRL